MNFDDILHKLLISEQEIIAYFCRLYSLDILSLCMRLTFLNLQISVETLCTKAKANLTSLLSKGFSIQFVNKTLVQNA